MWSSVATIFAATAGFCRSGWIVVQMRTFWVASAIAAIRVTDSSEVPQWSV
jgi:hypothetical protein